MSAQLIPANAIDPDAEHREWRRAFEWHLDQIPPLIETMGVLATPGIGVSRGGSRFDKVQITGGGYYDNVLIRDVRVESSGRIVDAGTTGDQAQLWAELVEYSRAVTAWINHEIPAPYAPDLPDIAHDRRQWVAPRPPADTWLARSLALTLVGWLIDHIDQVQQLEQLTEYQEAMFARIRRMKGRYRGASTVRRARPRLCATCGERAVIVDWIDAGNGSPKPIQSGICRVCGKTYTTNQQDRSTK